MNPVIAADGVVDRLVEACRHDMDRIGRPTVAALVWEEAV